VPSDLNFKNGHTFGNLQHAPQLTHLPVLFFATGNMEVNVLLIFANQVFLFLLAIYFVLFNNINFSISKNHP